MSALGPLAVPRLGRVDARVLTDYSNCWLGMFAEHH
ncbi:Uncharacterised protein [Mycobacterium tuberculosis]|nr:Uncharacterised protein [Mycobacterium tuberculosis]